MFYKLVVWVLACPSKLFHLCSEPRHHSYKLLVSTPSVLQLSVLLWASPWDLGDKIFLSVLHQSCRALLPRRLKEQEMNRSQDSLGSLWSKTVVTESVWGKFLGGPGVPVHWGCEVNRPEGCGLSFVPFIKSRTVLHLPCLVACPRDRPPIIAASGTTACSMHGSAAVHEHWSQNSSSISFHHHHYPWSYNFLVRSVRFFKP